MKRTLHNLSLLFCLAVAVLASCVYEDEVPCPCGVRLVYDMNMEFADAFSAQVDDVTLLIFDAEGRYLDTRTAQGLLGRAGGSRMELGDLPVGTYQLLAWAGLCNEAAPYALLPAPPVPGETTLSQLMLRLEGLERGEYGEPLTDVWHGLLTDFTVTGHSPAEGTIRLTKDTNRFRILVQTAGQAMHAADYRLGISAANACLGWDNRPTQGAEVVYRPYVQTEEAIEDAEGGTAVTALAAEMAAHIPATPPPTTTKSKLPLSSGRSGIASRRFLKVAIPSTGAPGLRDRRIESNLPSNPVRSWTQILWFPCSR